MDDILFSPGSMYQIFGLYIMQKRPLVACSSYRNLLVLLKP